MGLARAGCCGGAVVVQVDLGVADLMAAKEQADLEGAAVVQVGLVAFEEVC